MKKWLAGLAFFVCLMVSASPLAYAGDFVTLAQTGVLQLKNDQAWEKSYQTDLGKFKIRFRKLWNKSEKKKYHLLIWWNGERIADGYCPSSRYGYSFKIFQNQATQRIYVALETPSRVSLMGYDQVANRLEKYADSKAYYSPQPNPRLFVDRNGELILSFIGNGKVIPTKYRLFWDAGKNWFGYQDVTQRPVETEEQEDTPVYEPQYEAPSYDEWQHIESTEEAAVTEGELYYYEEEIVVGS